MAAECSENLWCRPFVTVRNWAALSACIFVLSGVAGCKSTSAATGETLSGAAPSTAVSIPVVEDKSEGDKQSVAFNPGLVEIAPDELKKYSQVVAVSDVHGHYLNALHLLQKAQIMDANGKWAGGKTLLVVVGDSIDKGPSSLAVLRCWLDLRAQADKVGGRVLVLLGNHESEFLADTSGKRLSPDIKKELDAEGMTREQLAGDAPDPKGYKLGAFLRQMPLGAKIGTWLFCHAGWPPDSQGLAPAKSTPAALWSAWKAQAQKQDYAALTQEGEQGKTGTEYSVLEKKFVGEEGNQESQSGGAAKWWESEQEVGRLLVRLDQFGFTGVVFGHQPAAFGLKDAVGPYANPQTNAPNYRLLKIDSGMATAPYDGLRDGEQPRNAGHLLVFKNVSILTQSMEGFKSDAPLLGMVIIANAENTAK